jgi:hypothetical protein
MRRPLRFVRMLKWAGTLASAFALILMMLSLKMSFAWWDKGVRHGVVVTAGAVAFVWVPVFPAGFNSFQTPGFSLTGDPWDNAMYSWSQYAEWPKSGWSWPARYVTVPLWQIFLALLLPSSLLWRTDRPVPPGHCRKCRYNLAGNTTRRCPECGTAIRPALSEPRL